MPQITVFSVVLAVFILLYRYHKPLTHWYYYPDRGEK